MKGNQVSRRNALTSKAPLEQLIRYPLALPIAAGTISMSTMEIIEENARIAKALKPLTPAEMKKLSQGLPARHKASLDAFFENHVDY